MNHPTCMFQRFGVCCIHSATAEQAPIEFWLSLTNKVLFPACRQSLTQNQCAGRSLAVRCVSFVPPCELHSTWKQDPLRAFVRTQRETRIGALRLPSRRCTRHAETELSVLGSTVAPRKRLALLAADCDRPWGRRSFLAFRGCVRKRSRCATDCCLI